MALIEQRWWPRVARPYVGLAVFLAQSDNRLGVADRLPGWQPSRRVMRGKRVHEIQGGLRIRGCDAVDKTSGRTGVILVDAPLPRAPPEVHLIRTAAIIRACGCTEAGPIDRERRQARPRLWREQDVSCHDGHIAGHGGEPGASWFRIFLAQVGRA